MSQSILTTGAFWGATLERAIKTAAQAVLALLTTNAIGVTSIDWAQVPSVAGLAAFVSVLTSIASAGIGNRGPSLGPEQVTTPAIEKEKS